ncbi:MAG: histidinol-phosphatase [Limnochordaceae bacterium]|nr:histidinol-phosphatase [Limnochordaceae bacterium]
MHSKYVPATDEDQPVTPQKETFVRIPHDYHLHLALDEASMPPWHDADLLLSYARQAAERGVAEIGISEHCHRFREFRPLMEYLVTGAGYPKIQQWLAGQFCWSLADYVEYVQEQGRRAPIPIRLGLEVDFFPGQEGALRTLLSLYPWDYLLGSVHFLGTWGFDIDPHLGWPQTPDAIDQVWKTYWQIWSQAAASGLFSSLAHPDLPKKFGARWSPAAAEACRTLIQQALQQAAASGTAIEINSAGLRKPVGELYPSVAILQEACQLGVGITLGSDAHCLDDVGRGLDEAVAAAKQAHYRHVAGFRRRQVQVQSFS